MNKISIKRKNLLDMYNLIMSLSNRGDVTIKAAYALTKNKNSLAGEHEAITEAMKKIDTEKWNEFEKKRIELCKDYCLKEENGSPKIDIQSGQPMFVLDPEKKVEFDEKSKLIFDEYKETIDLHNTQSDDFEKVFLQEEIEIDVYKVKLSELENLSGITMMQLESLLPVIDE